MEDYNKGENVLRDKIGIVALGCAVVLTCLAAHMVHFLQCRFRIGRLIIVNWEKKRR